MQKLPEIKKGENVTLGKIVQPSKYPRIIYELRPNISVYFQNGLVEINNQGWRTKEPALKKEKNTVRIIGLGDSFMFGQGVNQNKDWITILEDKLNTQFPQKKWEVINTAVPGYNTFMEVETLFQKALIYGPDITIIEYIGNDFDLPNFIYDSADDYLDLKKSFLTDLIFERYKLLRQSFKLIDAPLKKDVQYFRFENDPQKVPPQYKDMVGWESYFKAMVKLHKLQMVNKFDVISVLTINYSDAKVFNLSRRLGFYVTYNKAFNPNDLSLVLSKDDNHYSELEHKKTAEAILDFMVESKIIDKYLHK
jgi:hypothetical protein